LYFDFCKFLFRRLCAAATAKTKFIYVSGQNLYTPQHKKFFIQGTNVGNWLNPEGYMFLLGETSSYRLINQAFSEMVGPEFTARFWRDFKKNYITREDILYIKSTGMNTVRVPFHYKLFTDEDYMGITGKQNGFEILDNVITWCKEAGLYVILDMHNAPGGQTGDNIDDSYGYPWLFVNAENQKQFIDIWKKIAKHYANESAVLGYDLLNEPIAHYFKDDYNILNTALEPLFKRATTAIRTVDKNHIIFLAGAQWNSNFSVFSDWKFDNNIAYTCHRYWSGTEKKDIQDFLDFREKVNLPLFMGETGENTDEWVEKFRIALEENNIGWTFWPYKKMPHKAGMIAISKPENWDLIIEYTQKDRSSFEKIRTARPDQEKVKKAMLDLLENIKFKNCKKLDGYTKALGMKP
jgi:aryl-phospho-beta-D-glucosidase BglC (GH1 family)